MTLKKGDPVFLPGYPHPAFVDGAMRPGPCGGMVVDLIGHGPGSITVAGYAHIGLIRSRRSPATRLAPEHPPCTCDIWSGPCTCGAMERERAAMSAP